jgi:hypothetical protein
MKLSNHGVTEATEIHGKDFSVILRVFSVSVVDIKIPRGIYQSAIGSQQLNSDAGCAMWDVK